MEQESDKLNEIVEPAFGAESLAGEESKPAKKTKKRKFKKAAPVVEEPVVVKPVVQPEPLIEGQVIGGKFVKTNEGKLLHTKEGEVAKFATKGAAIIASKRYGGRLSETAIGFVVRG